LYFYQRERDTETHAEKEKKNLGAATIRDDAFYFLSTGPFSAIRQVFATHIGAVSYEG
jgi:hypothetical protein